MLVLSRKKNDSIVINGNVTIEVIQIKGNQVRLGIKAPQDVRILRGELKPYDVYPQPGERSDSAEAITADSREAIMADSGEVTFDLSELVAQAS